MRGTSGIAVSTLLALAHPLPSAVFLHCLFVECVVIVGCVNLGWLINKFHTMIICRYTGLCSCMHNGSTDKYNTFLENNLELLAIKIVGYLVKFHQDLE